jgi:hypothetical protein
MCAAPVTRSKRTMSRTAAPRRRKGAGDSQGPGKRQTTAILASRERLMLNLAAARISGQGSQFSANAEELLTRWWAKASWHQRREILRTVDWLLRLETHRNPAAPTAGWMGSGG